MSLYSIYFCFRMNKSKSTQMDRIHRNSRIPARISGGMKSIDHCHQQPPPATIAWPPQQLLCTPTTTTVWQHHITRWMNNDNGRPWPGMCHIIQMVMTHVVVTILIIPGEQCISPTPLLFSHEKQSSLHQCDNQWWTSNVLAHLLTCHIVWAVTMHVIITVLTITGEQPPFFFFSYQMWGATSHWQCGNHMTQDKRWVTTTTNDCTTTIIVAFIIIVSPSIPPLPFPTQLTSHHHQTKDSGHSHVTPPQRQSAMTTTDHDHNNNMTRPCNNHSMTTSRTDHLLHHYCFALVFSLSY